MLTVGDLWIGLLYVEHTFPIQVGMDYKKPLNGKLIKHFLLTACHPGKILNIIYFQEHLTQPIVTQHKQLLKVRGQI